MSVLTLDVCHQTIVLESVVAAIVTAVAVPDAATFTDLTVKKWVFSTAQTPTVTIVQSAPATGTVQIRMRGYDPRGEWIEEISPSLGISAKTNNHIYMSRLFREVVEVAYIASGMSVGATIAVGQVNDLARTNSAGTQHIAPTNFGFWVPGQKSSRTGLGPYQLGERCDPVETRVVHCHMLNVTTGKVWIGLADSETMGVSATSWTGADDKVGFDFSKFEAANDTAPVHTLSNTINIFLVTQSEE